MAKKTVSETPKEEKDTTGRGDAPSTAIVNYDEEFAAAAASAAAMEANAGGGQFFGTRGGILTWDKNPVEGNQMAVIIADHLLTNVFYEGSFDPDNPQNPKCFALGKVEADMKPHLTVFQAEQEEHETCAGCSRNEWGSADKGKGKACKNSRRLSLLSAGQVDRDGRLKKLVDLEELKVQPFGYLNLPVTSIKGWAAYVKQLAATIGYPPHGVVTLIKVVPDPKSQFKITFSALSKLESAYLPIMSARHKEAEKTIDFPFALGEREQQAQAPAGKGGKVATPKGRSKKY